MYGKSQMGTGTQSGLQICWPLRSPLSQSKHMAKHQQTLVLNISSSAYTSDDLPATLKPKIPAVVPLGTGFGEVI